MRAPRSFTRLFPSPARRLALIHSLPFIAILVIVAGFVLLAFPYTKPFPYADDWTYPLQLDASFRHKFAWLFQQHTDHRIPVLKLAQLTTLWLFNFDFRILILLNVIVVAAGAAFLVLTLRGYRGRGLFADVLVPLICLNLGAGLFG